MRLLLLLYQQLLQKDSEKFEWHMLYVCVERFRILPRRQWYQMLLFFFLRLFKQPVQKNRERFQWHMLYLCVEILHPLGRRMHHVYVLQLPILWVR